MKLEVGKYYLTRSGEKVGPMELSCFEPCFKATVAGIGRLFEPSGKHGDGCMIAPDIENEPSLDLVSEYTEDKLWEDLSDEEKGALLLAYHRGEPIEWSFETPFRRSFSTEQGGTPIWEDKICYRVVPKEAKRKRVELFVDSSELSAGFLECRNDTHRITFDTVNGEPDCNSIKMEKI